MTAASPGNANRATVRRVESIAIAVVLVAAFHAVPAWLLHFLPAKNIYARLGDKGLAGFYDCLTLLLPLVLCLTTIRRSGLRVGVWREHWLLVVGICALPPIATAIIYPFTSQPFTGANMGMWLISPAAQDLLFTGYLYGLLAKTFPGSFGRRIRVRHAVLLTAVFFALWHIPNFAGIQASYVLFQLLYTFVGCAWVLIARQLTGSLLPGLATHMAVNAIAWAGW